MIIIPSTSNKIFKYPLFIILLFLFTTLFTIIINNLPENRAFERKKAFASFAKTITEEDLKMLRSYNLGSLGMNCWWIKDGIGGFSVEQFWQEDNNKLKILDQPQNFFSSFNLSVTVTDSIGFIFINGLSEKALSLEFYDLNRRKIETREVILDAAQINPVRLFNF